jgi:hypothetical protein
MKKTLTFALSLMISIVAYAQKATISLNLQLDSSYYMITKAKMHMIQNISGQTQDINITISGKMSFKVKTIKDTVYMMEARYEKLRMQMESAAVNMDMNSDAGDKQNPLSILIHNMTRNSFKVNLSKKGRVLSVEDFDKLISGMFDGIPQISEAQKEQFKNQMIQSFGPTAMKGSLEITTAFFPNNPIAKSDQWTINTSLESAISAKIKTVYTLQNTDEKTYTIHGDGVITSLPVDDYKMVNGLPMKYIINGTSTNELKVDKATGWVLEAKINQSINGDVQIKDNPKVPGGMTIPMTLTTDQIITDK